MSRSSTQVPFTHHDDSKACHPVHSQTRKPTLRYAKAKDTYSKESGRLDAPFEHQASGPKDMVVVSLLGLLSVASKKR